MKRLVILWFLVLLSGSAFAQVPEESKTDLAVIKQRIHSTNDFQTPVAGSLHAEAANNDNLVRFFYGYWDHLEGPEDGRGFLDHVNTGKSLSANVADIAGQGIHAIPMIEGFSANDSREVWRDRLEDKAAQLRPYVDQIPFMILIDEPYSRGWTDEKLEWLIEDARQIMGDDLKYAYTVKQLSTSLRQRPDRRLPQNADYIGINYYPFRFEGGVDNQSEFNAEIISVLEEAREKVGEHTRLFLVGQAFYNNEKWHQPPAESPLWYAEVVRDQRLAALLWFEWRDRSRSGTRSMPQLYEWQKKAGKLLIGGKN